MTQTDIQTHTPPEPEPDHDAWEPGEQRRALVRLGLVVAAAVIAAVVTDVVKTVAVVAALLLMIMLHEFGHFVTAKWSGMKVTEYFLGFGPRLWSVRKGETEYGIKALPLGGYVRIVGMSNIEPVEPEDEARTYRQQGYWKRLLVASAGSIMHFLIALVLLWTLFVFVGRPNYDKPKPVVDTLSRLETGPSPAQEAGFQVGDRIVSVDGRPVRLWDDLRDYIRTRPNADLHFVVDRRGQTLNLTAHTIDLESVRVKDVPAVDRPTGFIGIGGGSPTIEKFGPLPGAGRAVTFLGTTTKQTVVALGDLFSAHGVRGYVDEVSGSGKTTDDPGAPRFLSPVGFVRVAGQAADTGWANTLLLLVLINVFVGIFNMLPVPPFDGGHVAIATYEAVRSRKGRRYFADGRKVVAAAYPVIALLLMIFVTSVFLDIAHPAANPFR
jgi:membrane-associated protease RseP (regulator of RpoE activity)